MLIKNLNSKCDGAIQETAKTDRNSTIVLRDYYHFMWIILIFAHKFWKIYTFLMYNCFHPLKIHLPFFFILYWIPVIGKYTVPKCKQHNYREYYAHFPDIKTLLLLRTWHRRCKRLKGWNEPFYERKYTTFKPKKTKNSIKLK